VTGWTGGNSLLVHAHSFIFAIFFQYCCKFSKFVSLINITGSIKLLSLKFPAEKAIRSCLTIEKINAPMQPELTPYGKPI